MKRFILPLCLALVATATAHAASPIKVTTDNGVVIAGSNTYMTLYTYAKDAGGVPSCYDACAEKWPPHLAEYWDSPRPPFSTIERKDGKKQWTKDPANLRYSNLGIVLANH